MHPDDLAAQFEAGYLPTDQDFDDHLPASLRPISERHFTPLHVVSRAVRWLVSAGARSVVDVGSGAGKFCVAAALSSDLTCIGLEQRPRLVSAARALARTFQVDDRVRFDRCLFGTSAVPRADAYYFYNPFAENISGSAASIDHDVELGRARFRCELRLTYAFLSALPRGSLVLTYHGFGARIPAAFDEIHVEHQEPALLRLFRKATA